MGVDPLADPASLGPPGSSAVYNVTTGQGILGRDSGVAYAWRSPRRLRLGEISAITVDGIGRRGVSIRGWEATREWGRATAPRSPLKAETTAAILRWMEQRAEILRLRWRVADLERERERWGDAALVAAIGPAAEWSTAAPGARAAASPGERPPTPKVLSLRVLRGGGVDYRPTAYWRPEDPAEWGEAAEITIRTLALPASPEDEHMWGPLNLSERRGGSTEVRVHSTRFTRIRTVDGRSDLDGVQQRLAELLAAGRGAARIAARPAIPYYKSRNMGAQLRANRDRAREAYGSAHREAGEDAPVLLDLAAGEELGYAAPAGGLNTAEPIEGLGRLLCAAWGIPETLMFGTSPGGLNSPGDSEERNWHNVVRRVQSELEPAVVAVYRRLAVELAAELHALADADEAKGDAASSAERRAIAEAVEQLDVGFEWAPLRTLSAVEEADWRLKTAQWQEKYAAMGAIRVDEIRASTFGGEGFNPDVAVIERPEDAKLAKPIPVGTAQAALTVAQAFYAGQLPEAAARALLGALDPNLAAVATEIISAAQRGGVTNPAAVPAPALAGPAGEPLAADEIPATYTEPEVMRAIRVGRRTIARWVSEGRLQAFDAGGGRRRYRKAQVHALFEVDPDAKAEAEAGGPPPAEIAAAVRDAGE